VQTQNVQAALGRVGAAPITNDQQYQITVKTKGRLTTPEEFVGNVTGDLNKRRGIIVNSEQRGNTRIVEAEVPLSEMFGYTTELRSMSTGRAAAAMTRGCARLSPAAYNCARGRPVR